MKDKDPIILSGDDVISIDKKFGLKMTKFRTIDQSIRTSIGASFQYYDEWTKKGIGAEVLQPGKGWQKGTLKLVISYRVEFTPDSDTPSQSLLDCL